MAVYTIGTASGGYYNNRGNLAPWAFGSSVNLGGKHISSFGLQMASNSGSTTVKGRIWNSAGNAVWTSPDTTINQDTSAPFGVVTFTPDTYISDAYYFGFIKGTSSVNWDVVNGDNSTITGNDSISTTGTGTIYRRLVGSITYFDPGAPSAPGVSSSPYNGGITVSYSAPASAGGNGLSVSYYQYSTDNANWTTTPSNPFNVSGTNGTALTVYVRAVNNAGVGGTSASTTSTPRTTPSAPQSFAASNATFGQLNLTWSAPANDGGESVDGYKLRTGAVVGSGTLLQDSTATSYNHTGLNPNTSYSYNVVAYNAAGEGAGATVTQTTIGGIGKIWNGTTWVNVLPKVWNGTAWVDAQARIWNGTEWKYGS